MATLAWRVTVTTDRSSLAPVKPGRLALRESAGSPTKQGSPMWTGSSRSSRSSGASPLQKPSAALHLGWYAKYTHFYRAWKKRFLVLKGVRLLYYKSTSPDAKGAHPFRRRGSVRVSGWRELPGRPHAVLVKASPSDVMLQAESAEQLRRLTDAIDAALGCLAPSLRAVSPFGDAVTVGASPMVPPPPPMSPPPPPPQDLVPALPVLSGLAHVRASRASGSAPLVVIQSNVREGSGEATVAAESQTDFDTMLEREGEGAREQEMEAQLAGKEEPEAQRAGEEGAEAHSAGEGVAGAHSPGKEKVGICSKQDDVAGVDPPAKAVHAAQEPSEAQRGAPQEGFAAAASPNVPPLALAATTEGLELAQARSLPAHASQVRPLALAAATNGRESPPQAASADPSAPPSPPVHEGLARGLAQISTLESACNRMTPRGSEFASRNAGRKLGIDDFQVERVLGRGAFAHVALAKSKQTGKSYAIKSLNKRMLIAKYQVQATVTERDILRNASGHPFIVGLHAAFSSELHLHLVLDFLPGGDLQARLLERGRLPHAEALLYLAELSLALACVHDECGAIYRDLKPSNVLLDARGHAVLADFGLSKLASAGTSFCGTAEYIAPEAMRRSQYDKTVDWWALGVVLFELLAGHTPFQDRSIPAVQRNILDATPLPPIPPPGVDIAPEAAAIIAELLQRDSSLRLGRGTNGTAEVQAHPFFTSLDFDRVRQRGYPPAWTPPREGRLLRKSFRDSQGNLLQALPPDEIDEDLPGYSSSSSTGESAGSDAETGTPPPDPRFLGFSFVH